MAGYDISSVLGLVSPWKAKIPINGCRPRYCVSLIAILYSYARQTLTYARYISDVGAQKLKPLFIAMGGASVIIFDIVFLLERWLRHSGKLVHYKSNFQRFLAVGSTFFAVAGAAGFILLACFDTYRHKTLHDVFLAVFMSVKRAFYVLIKLIFLLVEDMLLAPSLS